MKKFEGRSGSMRTMRRAMLLAGTSFAFLGATVAAAQDVTPPEEDAAADAPIIVTGSRIKSPTLTSPSPIQVLSSETLENRGTINVQDALQTNPAFGNAGSSRTTSNNNIAQVGVATVNLRGLGANRTLVLIDGRRVVAGVPGTSQVDLSMIPSPFIERVDVLTGGASAVYGSDAVAGVVNFIYKKNFEGVLVNAQAGISQYGDDDQYSANITLGQNFADDRGNFMVYAGWTKQGLILAKDRARTSQDFFSLGNTQLRANQRNDVNLTAAQNLFTPVIQYSGVVPAGTFTAGSTNFTVDANGVARPFNSATDGFNREPFLGLSSPVERRMFAARANYELNDQINLFVEGTYANTKSTSYFEPSPLLSAGALGVFRGSSGFFGIEQNVVNPANGQVVRVVNPLVPTAIFNAATDRTGDGFKDISFSLRQADFPPGQRIAPTDRDNFRVVLGAEGDLSDRWSYNVYYQYGMTKLNQEMQGLVNQFRFANAMNVITDVFDFDRDGSTTDAVCASAEARAEGCVPINIYGRGNMSPDAVKYVSASLLHNAKQTQNVASANLTGSLFDLPAGPIAVAVGAEYRKESSRDIFDPLSNIARNGFTQQTDTAGSFDVKEAYGEIQIPVLKESAVGSLTIRGAGRVSDYSTVGTVYAYNGGIEWSPIRDIRLRAVYAHAVRAPNIGELFAPGAVGIATVNDPCVGVTLTSSDAKSIKCRADASVLANINANGGTFTLSQSDTQGVAVLGTSNANIQPETGKTYTLGVVINPVSIDALRNLVFTADYFNIKLKGAIARPSADVYLSKCYVAGIDDFCQFIDRRDAAAAPYSVGSIELITRDLVNSGGAFTEGLDFTLGYRHQLFGGTLTMSAAWTHLLKNGGRPLEGDPIDTTLGEVGTPKDKGSLTFDYEIGEFGITFSNQYLGPQYLDDQYRNRFLLADGSLADKKFFRIGAKVYTDLQLKWNVSEAYQFYVGSNNLFNVKAPAIWQGLPGNVINAATASGTYDAIGRRFYAGVRAKF